MLCKKVPVIKYPFLVDKALDHCIVKHQAIKVNTVHKWYCIMKNNAFPPDLSEGPALVTGYFNGKMNDDLSVLYTDDENELIYIFTILSEDFNLTYKKDFVCGEILPFVWDESRQYCVRSVFNVDIPWLMLIRTPVYVILRKINPSKMEDIINSLYQLKEVFEVSNRNWKILVSQKDGFCIHELIRFHK